MKKKSLNFKLPIKTARRLSRRKLRGGWPVPAGYPAEAYNYEEKRLDLNEYIIRDKGNNRCLWATHRGLTGDCIEIGDLIVYDKALAGKKDSLRLFLIDDEYTIRRVVKHKEYIELVSPNPGIDPLSVYEGESLVCEGVVTHNIKKFANYHRQYAGYPVDAEMYIEHGMDYNKYLVDWWETTFYLWAQGDSMKGDCIEKGDLLVVDNMPDAYPGQIHVFVIDKQYTLKRVVEGDEYNMLVSSNPEIPPIQIKKGEELKRWGLLTAVIKKMI